MESDISTKMRILKKALKIVLKILYQVLIILCVLLIMIIALQKITDSSRSIGGYRIFRVITGSMVPEYDVGEVVISKETPAEDIKIGNDIVYLGKYGDYAGRIIMHEVIGIDKDENGNFNFHAKGLHSGSVEDPQIKVDQIYGVVKVKSRLLTILYDLATSIYSSFIIITILVLNVFISFRFPGRKKVQQLNEPYNEDVEEIEEDIDDIDIEDEYEEEYESDEDIEENDELEE